MLKPGGGGGKLHVPNGIRCVIASRHERVEVSVEAEGAFTAFCRAGFHL